MRDIYWRDALQWGQRLERNRGVYDFTVIDKGLDEAGRRGGRFSFRIMAYCPNCGGNLAPAYIPQQQNGAPDWNSDEFLNGYSAMMTEIGRRYGTDPRLGTIDVGGYGLYGEWWCEDYACGTRITMDNARRLVKAVADAFPEKHVLLGHDATMGPELTKYSQRIGTRYDCVGGREIDLAYLSQEYRDIWKRAPVVGEWCNWDRTSPEKALQNIEAFHISALSSGNYPRTESQRSTEENAKLREVHAAIGYRYSVRDVAVFGTANADSDVVVSSTWENDGQAPTYDAWRVELRLVNIAGQVMSVANAGLDLRELTSGRTTIRTKLRIPEGASGCLRIDVLTVDPVDYLDPMTLNNPGRDASGAYPVATLSVG